MKIAVLIPIWILLNLPAHAQGTLKGCVFDQKKEPLINTTVIIYQNGVQKESIITDFDGKYVVKSLDTGCYTIIVAYIECDSGKTSDILVVPNQITMWNFQLKCKKGKTIIAD